MIPWIDEIGDRLGLPYPRHPDGSLYKGQLIRVLLPEWPEERVAPAVALGVKDRRGRHRVRYYDRQGRPCVHWAKASEVLL